MLDVDELDIVAILQTQAANRGSANALMCMHALDIIERLQSPRAVCDAFEALVRPNGCSGDRVTGISWGSSHVTLERENDAMDANDVDGTSLADAYEQLGKGKVHGE